MSEEERDVKLEEVALKYQDLITKSYDTLALEAFNIKTHRFDMKTECMIRAGYFRAPRRYAQWITKKRGCSSHEAALEKLSIDELRAKSDVFRNIIKADQKEIQDEIDALIVAADKEEDIDKKHLLKYLLHFGELLSKNI